MSQKDSNSSKKLDDTSAASGDSSHNEISIFIADLRKVIEEKHLDKNYIGSLLARLNEKSASVDRALQFMSNVKTMKSSQISESEQIQLDEVNDRLQGTLLPELQNLVENVKSADLNKVDETVNVIKEMKTQMMIARNVIHEALNTAAESQDLDVTEAQDITVNQPPPALPISTLPGEEKSNELSELSLEKEKIITLTEKLHSTEEELKKCKKGKNDARKWKRKFEVIKRMNKNLLEKSSGVSDESLSTNDSVSNLVETTCSEDSWKTRYDDVCRKLETSEKSLEVQQEMNASITTSAAEIQQNLSSENSALKEVIQRMKADADKHEKELSQTKLLERTKIDVLVNMAEEEKQKIRQECDSLMCQLELTKKRLEDQKAEAKRHLDNEIWKMKKAAKAAEKRRKRRNSASKSPAKKDESKARTTGDYIVSKLITDLTTLRDFVERDHSPETIVQIAELFKASLQAAEDISLHIAKLEVSLGESLSINAFKDQALEDLTKTNEMRAEEYEIVIRAEREKHEALNKVIEESKEKEEASAKRWKELDEQEKLLEENRKHLETEAVTSNKHLMSLEEENSNLKQELSDLREKEAHKSLNFEKVHEENLELRKSLAVATKQLEASLTPNKDRTSQLESRLETIQRSAKAQHKRLEDDLISARAQLEKLTSRNDELLLINKQLYQKSLLADEMSASLSQKMEDSAKSISELKKTVSLLEDENKSLMFVNGEERAGLVNELVATKEKLKECQNVSSLNAIKSDELLSLENELKITKSELEQLRKCDTAMQLSSQDAIEQQSPIHNMFPDLDPLLRQLVHILAGNQNYMYGVFGVVIYIFLIHLYILL